MAKVFAQPGVTPGTGAGTIGNPYSYQDLASTTNITGVGAGDALCMMTDGATADTPTAVMGMPGIADLWIGSVDYAGNPSKDRWIADFAGVGAGIAFSVTNARQKVLLPEIRNSPGVGISFSSIADHSYLYGAKVLGPASHGIQVNNGADSIRLRDIWVEGAGGSAVVLTDFDTPFLSRFFIKHSNSNPAILVASFAEINDGVIVIDATGLTNFTGITTTATTGCIVTTDHVIGIITGDTSSLTTPSAIFDDNTTGLSGDLVVLNPLVLVDGVDRADIYAVLKSAGAAAGANTFYDAVKYNMANIVNNDPSANSPWWVANTVDPDLVDIAGNDFRPQVDLTTYAILKKLAEEDIDWRDPGALSHVLAASGGGGYRPRIARG